MTWFLIGIGLLGDIQFETDWRLALEPLEIYEADVAIAINDQDTIALLDYGEKRLTLADTSGEVLARCGGPGQGPGEMTRPLQVLWKAEQRVFAVIDEGNGRLSLWRETGEPAGEVPFPGRPVQLSFQGPDRVLFLRDAHANRGPGPALCRYDLKSRELKILWTYEPPTSKEITTSLTGGVQISIVFDWDPGLHYAQGSDFIAVGFGDTDKVRFLDRDGAPTGRTMTVDLPLHEVTGEQVDERVDNLNPRFQAAARQALVDPGDWPIIRAIHIDDRDRIWVLGSAAVRGKIPFRVYDRSGETLQRGFLAHYPRIITSQHMVFIQERDDEVVLVKNRWRFSNGPKP